MGKEAEGAFICVSVLNNTLAMTIGPPNLRRVAQLVPRKYGARQQLIPHYSFFIPN